MMLSDYCKSTFFRGYLFLRFSLHGHFCGNLFSQTAEIDYAKTMQSMSTWTLLRQFIFMNFSSQK